MKLIFELWDTEDSNLIGTFESEDEALQVVRTAVEEHGAGAFAMIALGRDDGHGRMMPVAMGEELVQLATEQDGIEQPRTEASR